MNEHFFKQWLNNSSGSESHSFEDAIREEHSIEITLSNASGYAKSQRLDFTSGQCEFSELLPDDYTLYVEGGRCLWDGKLIASQLIQDDSLPLELAADSGDETISPSAQFELIPNECEMLVYAGLESGRVCIRIMTP